MTSIENALERAWESHQTGGEFSAFEHLHTACKLIHCWIKAQEASSLPRNLPSEAPEAPGWSIPPLDLESRSNRQSKAIAEALRWLRANCKHKAIEELERVL